MIKTLLKIQKATLISDITTLPWRLQGYTDIGDKGEVLSIGNIFICFKVS